MEPTGVIEKKKKARRGKRKRRESESETVARTGNERTLWRRAKRSKKEGSGVANKKKIEQRTRIRLRRRLEKNGVKYRYTDPWTRIKLGPRAFDDKLSDPTLPDCLKHVNDEQLFTNEVLVDVLEHLQKRVYQNKCGTVTIAWNKKMNGTTAAECRSKSKKEHEIMVNPEIVTCKLQLYLTVGHELAHAYVAATTDSDDTNHGNPYIKALESFLDFDSKMDVYMPIRALPNFKKYIYECIDPDCGKIYSVDRPKRFCSCGDDLLCYLKNGDYVPIDEFLKLFDDAEPSSDSNIDIVVEEDELNDLK